MNITDETLSAFLDAELSEPDMQAVRDSLRADPALSDRLAELAAVDSQLLRHYSAIDDQPLPVAVTDRLAAEESAEPTACSSGTVVVFPWWRRLPQGVRQHAGVAVAAVLVMALGLAQLLPRAPDMPWQRVAAQLETAPSGKPVQLTDANTLTPRLTFRNQQGEYCRQFHLEGLEQASENIACRTGKSWKLVAKTEVEPSPEKGGYQTASGGSVMDDTLDRMMAGAVIGPAEERQLINSRWGSAD